MAWGVAIWATRGWDAHGWIRIGVRMRFQALLGHFGPRGVGSGPFSIFLDFFYFFRIFFLIFPIIPGVAGLLFTGGRTAKKEGE